MAPVPKQPFSIAAVSRLLFWSAFLEAFLILSAWLIQPGYLTTSHRDLFTMKANTALGLCLLALSGLLAHPLGWSLPRRETAASGTALAAVLIGSATLLEYIFGWKFGIDQLLAHDFIIPQDALPGRMGAGTALNFIFCGLALAFPVKKIGKNLRLSSFCLFGCLTVSLLALMGHLFGITDLYTYSPFNFMAWQTALCFILICLGALAARPLSPFEEVSAAEAASGVHRGLNSYIWTGFMVILVFLMANAMLTYHNFSTLLSINQWVIHTRDALVSIEDVRSAVGETGKPAPRMEKERAFSLLLERAAALRALTADNPDQQKRMDRIDSILKKKTDLMSLASNGGMPVRDLLSDMRQEENGLLMERTQEARERMFKTRWSFGTTLMSALIFLLTAFFLWDRHIRFQRQLQQTELRLSTVIQNAPLILYSLDPKGVVTLSTGKGLEAIGLKPGGSTGKSVFDVYPENSSILEKVKMALGGEEAHGLTEVNGHFVEALYKPIKDKQGKVTEVVGVAIDVTARQKAQEAVKASEANYREIFEKINDAIYIHEMDTWRVIDINERTCELVEATREDILSGDPNAFITGEPGYTIEDAVEWIRKAAEGPQLFEWKAKTKKGRKIWVEVSLKRVVIAGQPRILALVRDISERKKLEETLQAQAFITSVLENVPNMIFVKDAKDLRFVMFNKAGEELLGIPRAELIGKSDYDFFPKEDADHFTAKDRKTLAEGRLLDIPEEPLRTKDKGERVLHTKKFPVPGPDGKPQYLIGISEDITEQKEQENLRVYAKALETSNQELQDFVFVASHDLQEPLRKIQSFGEFLRDEFKETLGETGRDYVQRMQSAAKRMQILINDLLVLTRVTTKAQPFILVDLSEVLQGVLSDLETRIGETKAKVEVGPLPTLPVDATQMRQLFQNLIGNALKFQRPGVEPRVSVRAKTSKDGKKCWITVEDNGIGFDNKYGEQIFKVFERLHGRDVYEGTGIGLAICRKVVERHGGTIKAESQTGKGSTFTVELPLRQTG